ncbi:MAG: extracellular solute-binding protein, partial [Chloroflexi bacterium]|nr:extracellular solute-binding protein [Chloroflexota bacterium]
MKRDTAFTRRSFMRLMGAAAGAAALAACAPSASPSPTPASAEGVGKPVAQQAAPTEKVKVRIQTPATVNTIDMVNKCIAEYMEANPDVEVVSEETVYNEISTKTETGFIAGTLQDICYGHSRWYAYGCARGIYQPLDDYIDASPPDDFDDFFPLVMEVNKFEGK